MQWSSQDSFGKRPPLILNEGAQEAAGYGALLRLGREQRASQLHALLSRSEWPLLAATKLIAIIVLALATHSAAPLPSRSLFALALAVDVAMGVMAALSPDGLRQPWRMVLFVAGTVAPMALFGLGVGVWSLAAEGPPWPLSLAVVGIVALVCNIAAFSRLPASLGAQVGLWGGLSLVAGGPIAKLAMAIAVIIALAASLSHWSRQRQIAARARAERHVQTRAVEVLAGYEATGQGWFWETDAEGCLTYLSATVARQLRPSGRSLIGAPIASLFTDACPDGAEALRRLNFHMSGESPFRELPLRAGVADEERWWSVTGAPTLSSDGAFRGFRGWGSDLTEQRRAEQFAARMASFDSLTGLANRFQMSQTLEKLLTEGGDDAPRECTVMLLDLDRFKRVNDTRGHPVGDALLREVARRLEQVVGHAGCVGRQGGDEFQVILPGKTDHQALAQLAEKIVAQLCEPYRVAGQEMSIGASIGIARAPRDGVTSDALIRNADVALYRAKDEGRCRFAFYAPDMHDDADERRQLAHDLKQAMVHGGLHIVYQPIVEVATEKVVGFEALLRWNHPEQGEIPPARFVPIAEDSGLIAPLGEWVLRTACKDMAGWAEHLRLAVNLSSLQFANPGLPAVITNALATAQVDAGRLELEITESVFVNGSEATARMFTALKNLGVRLVLDDFGTGYASLGYLRMAPFDRIKIDRNFVRNAATEGSGNAAVIASIVSLAEALGMETTAEGVERYEELALVRSLGCSHVQGYLYERGMTALEAGERSLEVHIPEPKNDRAPTAARRRVLRKVRVIHDGEDRAATLRNVSSDGGLIDGVQALPVGATIAVQIAERAPCLAVVRWSEEDRCGIQFAEPLVLDDSATLPLALMPPPPPERTRWMLPGRSADSQHRAC